MTFRQTIETTYADLRESDLVIDKSGQAWPIAELGPQEPVVSVTFWLCDPVTKIKMHYITALKIHPVTVSRLSTQGDEAAKLEAEFPGPSVEVYVEAQRQIKSIGASDEDADEAALFVANYLQNETVVLGSNETATELAEAGVEAVDMTDAVAGVEAILGGEVEAEVTAAEVDAANAATEDSPVSLPAFADMTILEMRSHLYLLHGVYAHDLRSRAETMTMHDQAHVDQEAGRLQSAYVPHVHGVK